MEPHEIDREGRETIARLCAEEGVDPSYGAFVGRHLRAPDATWRWCCGSSCDPCVERLARVVERARQALCTGPPALPESADPQ